MFLLMAPPPSILNRNMVLAERCALLSAEILKSQGKYSDAATLLIKMTSEVRNLSSFLILLLVRKCPRCTEHLTFFSCKQKCTSVSTISHLHR